MDTRAQGSPSMTIPTMCLIRNLAHPRLGFDWLSQRLDEGVFFGRLEWRFFDQKTR